MKTCACGGEIFKKSLAVEICSVDDEGNEDALVESVTLWDNHPEHPEYPFYACDRCGAKWETWDDIPCTTTKHHHKEECPMNRYTMKDYDIFYDNGKWVAVRAGFDGVRRNVAPYNCQTKQKATRAARRDRDDLNETIQWGKEEEGA